MNRRNTTSAATVVAAGLALSGALGFATAAAAADDDSAGIDVSVDVEEIVPPGTLALTVAPNDGVVLTEHDSDQTVRQFTGALPTVTVTDSRTTEEIPPGSYWAVTGQASAFTADGLAPIDASRLGWSPRLLSPAEGIVAPGEPVLGSLDGGPGIDSGSDLLVSTWEPGADASAVNVTADLTLKIPAETPAGQYRSTITLSLFENN
ncbi:hypothetical protein FLP10_07080 [Agromyces intestinalis]|uniref:WxL domain-containing protein n=1 Tax=Agromyces intestinalis TaxID=2592652 RepID=A0A5C1YDQ1_9MICO|nr:hypothetical protein [Agromyces intestinalis]QEO14206.1 hypothetical protein FLP10_07080 [Agromyces intestinalis]